MATKRPFPAFRPFTPCKHQVNIPAAIIAAPKRKLDARIHRLRISEVIYMQSDQYNNKQHPLVTAIAAQAYVRLELLLANIAQKTIQRTVANEIRPRLPRIAALTAGKRHSSIAITRTTVDANIKNDMQLVV